ncbi:MAG: zinc ABC transporter ATP-binding protein AztA [Microbacteriaceae bacterium]
MKEQLDIALSVAALGYSYADHIALSGIHANFPRGKVSAIVGGNGAGKSTLLQLIAGTLSPSTGTIRKTLKGRPAFVLQRSLSNSQLPFTVYECVAMGRWADLGAYRRMTESDKNIIHEAMEMLDIQNLAKRQLSELSGGQQQRALLAQGVAQQSDLLLLDEPVTGLDIEAEQRISAVIKQLSIDGKTVIQATHSMLAARESDHCLVLAHGRLLAEGDPEEVLSEKNLLEFF